jgi:Protein of unknown function (DUF1592)/Protein of unknown function (DUF1588)/Protein of unknown function (DUF1595)
MALALAAWVLLSCSRPAPTVPRIYAPGALLPARVRLLSNHELERSLHALLGDARGLAVRLPPDVRQSGYTRNALQAWTASSAVRWAALTDEYVAAATEQRLATLWPCTQANDSEQCRSAATTDLSLRAWRRPVSKVEQAALRRVFDSARVDGEVEGVKALLAALVQAPSFVYVTELGEPARDQNAEVVTLTAYELASQLSYMLSGGPPDAELLAHADSGQLKSKDVREAQAWRILGRSDTRHQFQRFVLEWLEVDRLLDTAKDEDSYPDYDPLKSKMIAETAGFSDEVFVNHGASVSALLDAGFASVDPGLARYYGLDAYGPAVSLAGTPRRGVLQQASVLAAHAHPDITSPVKRGDFILRRLLCTELPRPGELGIEVAMPAPKPDQNGRERMNAHSTNAGCASCHLQIDPLGFVFENFDAAGRVRAEDGGRPIDPRVSWTFRGTTHHFSDSVELSRWLAAQPHTQTCFERQAFRYFSAQTSAGPEDAFVALAAELPPERRANLIALLVGYVGSDLFTLRRVTR